MKNLSEATVRRVNNVINRKLKFDQARTNRVAQKLEQVQQSLNSKIDALNEDIANRLSNANYEDLIKLEIEKQSRISSLEKAYLKSEKLIEIIPFAELDDEMTKRIKRTSTNGQVALSKMQIQIQQAKQQREVEYKDQVASWARDEFVMRHKEEFKKYVQNYNLHVKNSNLTGEQYRKNFVTFMKNTTDEQRVNNEIDTLQIKHNIEENVSAEIYCEAYEEEYKNFIAERNAQSSTGQLDPNSEIAKCYYYAHCQKTNPVQVDKFKKYSNERRKLKIKERIENDRLPKHEKKTIKIKKQSKQQAVAPMQTAQTSGLTA